MRQSADMFVKPKVCSSALSLIWLAVLWLAPQAAWAEDAFVIVRDGRASATIVIAAEALPSNQYAAQELQSHIELMSGAVLPVVTDAQQVDGPRILIGQSLFTAALDLKVPSGFTRKLQEEGFVIKTTGRDLVLIGNDGGPLGGRQLNGFKNTYKGSLFAVYEMLERLGVRWYYPGEFGRIVPRTRNISIPETDETIRPSFPVRGFWYGAAPHRLKDPAFKELMDVWSLRNRFLGYGSVLDSARDGSVMTPFRKMARVQRDGKTVQVNTLFEEHPEYFALRLDGTRTPHYLCLSNPEVVRIATEYAIEYFRNNPDVHNFGYAPPDGAPTCNCDDCKAHNFNLMQKPPADPGIQDISEGFYRFLDQVARNVAREFPDKWITSTAYSGRIRPPEATSLSENISLHLAFLGYAQHHRLDAPGWQTQEKRTLLERWAAINPYMVERQYYPAMQLHANIILPLHRTHAYNVKQLKEMGIAGAEWEGRAAFKTDLLNYYVLGRMLWNVQTDIDALLDEHYHLFYGDAAKPIARFVNAAEQMLTGAEVEYHEEERLREIYPYKQVMEISAEVGDIEALVANADEPTRQRVHFARLFIDHFRAWSEMREYERQMSFEKAAEQARRMIAIEREMDTMSITLVDSYNELMDSRTKIYGELGANASAHGKLRQYETKQKMIDGTNGDLVAALPIQWDFRTDPTDKGLIARWYDPQATDRSDWKLLDTTRPWEPQGYQDKQLNGYDGIGWYRTSFDIPAKFEGRRIKLFIGGLNNQGWVWVNGQMVGYQPYHMFWQRWMYHHEIDITDHVRCGQVNHLSIRVLNDYNFGGMFRRSFIYSPISDAQ